MHKFILIALLALAGCASTPQSFDPSKLSPRQLVAVKKAMMVLLQATAEGAEYGTPGEPAAK